MRTKTVAAIAALAALIVHANGTAANAQVNGGGILGAILRAGAQSHAKQAWQAVSPPMQSCMDRALSQRNLSINALIRSGVSPDDNRLSQMTGRCQALVGRELQNNTECNIIEAGSSIATRCNESYAVVSGSQTRPISREQYINDGLRGANVTIMQIETDEARQARLARTQQEQAAAEAARQRQEAAEAALVKKNAEIARKKQEAADAAIRQTLARQDQAILAGRRACSVKGGGALTKLFGSGNDHAIMAELLNTNNPPLKVYQDTVAWLPSSNDRGAILSAWHDRIDYDAKNWGNVISRSGSGNYSWDALKGAMAAIASGCLWQQYDQLGVAAALRISPMSVQVAAGQARANDDPARVGAAILSRIPSNQYFH